MKTLLIDLDGVLNTYAGNFDKDTIPEIKAGAEKFLEKLSKDYEVKVFTARNRLLAAKWLIKNKLDNYVTDITNVKEPAFLLSCFLFNAFKPFAVFSFVKRECCCKQKLVSENRRSLFRRCFRLAASGRLRLTQKTLDDRCICFNGDFKKTLNEIEKFKTYWK